MFLDIGFCHNTMDALRSKSQDTRNRAFLAYPTNKYRAMLDLEHLSTFPPNPDNTAAEAPVTRLPFEMLEMVLLNCDPQTILLSQRVNKTWRDLIKNSQPLRRKIWLEPEKKIEQPKAEIREQHLLSKLISGPSVALNPFLVRDLHRIVQFTGLLDGRDNFYPRLRHEKRLSRKEIDRTLNGKAMSRQIVVQEDAIRVRREQAEIFFTTVVKLTAALKEAEEKNYSWNDMIVFQSQDIIGKNLTIAYEAVEKCSMDGVPGWNGRLGRYVRVHRIDAGKWDHSPTVGELANIVLERHTDIYMEE